MSGRSRDVRPYQALLESAILRNDGTWDFEDVVRRVAEGSMQCWPGVHSVILTEILDHPRIKAVHVLAAAGTLTEIEAMIPVLERWARAEGCHEALFTGRAGWERTFLAREGWKPLAVVFRKPLWDR